MVIAGDYNIVPEPRDIYVTTSYRDNALVQPAPRERVCAAVGAGLDRRDPAEVYPRETVYTFWDYMRNRWPRDAGLRLDHLLLSKKLGASCWMPGWIARCAGARSASDHAPAWVVLKD